jgi:RHS repeat-associated protein
MSISRTHSKPEVQRSAASGIPTGIEWSWFNHARYDGEGQRVMKATGSVSTTYVYDAGGQLAAEYTNEAVPATGTEYLTDDHLGSTRLVTGPSGNIVRRYDFLPFGEDLTAGTDGRSASTYNSALPVGPTQDWVNNKFTGKLRDNETGLDFFGARYFSAPEGRFTSADWSAKPEAVPYAELPDPQSLNLYSYVQNNPLGHVDADGHLGDIAVIEDGPTQGNPIGHTAIAIEGKGVFSFGTKTPLGSSTTDFLQMESPRRNQTVTIIKTTPEQDEAAAKELMKQNDKGAIDRYPDNCSARSNAGLDAAGIPQVGPDPTKLGQQSPSFFTPSDPSIPGSAGARARATPGSQTMEIPKHSKSLPANLNQFNPPPGKQPVPEKTTPNAGPSS